MAPVWICFLLQSPLKTEHQKDSTPLALISLFISHIPQEVKSSLKVNFFSVRSFCIGRWTTLCFPLGNADVCTTPRLIEWYLKAVSTE